MLTPREAESSWWVKTWRREENHCCCWLWESLLWYFKGNRSGCLRWPAYCLLTWYGSWPHWLCVQRTMNKAEWVCMCVCVSLYNRVLILIAVLCITLDCEYLGSSSRRSIRRLIQSVQCAAQSHWETLGTATQSFDPDPKWRQFFIFSLSLSF